MKTLWRLREFVRPYRGQVLLALLLLFGITALRMVIPEIIRRVIDIGLLGGDPRYMLGAALVILGVGLLRALFTFARRYLSEWIAHHVAYDLRNRLYDHIQRLPFAYHDHAQTGQLISRCTEDVRSIQRFTGFGLVELLQIALLMSGILVVLFLENARLAAIALLPIIPLLLTTTRFGQRVSRLFWRVDNALGALSARLQENVTGVAVVRAFAREQDEIERFDRLNRELYHARLTVVGEWSRVMPTTQLLTTLSTLLILWFGGRMVLRGEMTVGEVVAFNSYLVMLAMPARQIAWLVNAAGEAAAGVRRVFEVLETPPAIQSPPDAIVPDRLRGAVTFDHVSFAYQGEDLPALEDICLEVAPNTLVALIGRTGSGKTSLVNLIPRFYDVTAGAVYVDGVDVRRYDLHALRRQIGIVLQTSILFSATIRENIAYGRPDADEADIIAAAQAAQAHEFITRFPEGYDTLVGERGVTLSGGQRQRIAIARALLLDPRILILDDATSSVDTETERLIQQALDRLMEGRTTFVIAQRLSTVRRADLILVLDGGRIVERGTHAELLARGGLYREIYDLQWADQAAPAQP